MNLIEEVKKKLRDNREKAVNGKINCIPSPFSVFRRDFPGIEKDKYYLVSGAAKSAKTQITSLLFLYRPLLYAYKHQDKVRVRIIYFPLEETKQKITMRFMCYLLYVLSNQTIRVSPLDLQSIIEGRIVSEEILDLLDTKEYNDIFDFYLKCVQFEPDKNPTGCMKKVIKYAEDHGTIHKKWDETWQKMVFDYYVPNDPDEYVIIIWDHAGLTHMEKDKDTGKLLNLKETIDKLSGYFVDFRDKLHYTPVLIQQQNTDTISLEAFKFKKVMPTLNGLADTKNSGKDCSVMLGITNPHAFEMTEYRGYNINELGGYCRFLEVVMNREGESNGYLALYFDGAVNYFKPMPKEDDMEGLRAIYQRIAQNSTS